MFEKKTKLFESVRRKKFYNNIFQKFINHNNSKLYSRNTYVGVVLQNVLVVLLDIFLKNQFLKKVVVLGLMYYLQ